MTRPKMTLTLAAVLLGAVACGAGSKAEAKPRPAKTAVTKSMASKASGHHVQRGRASWYGPGFQGRRTANGERFDTHDLTAAHRTLPFGTRVKVTNERTGRSVVVRINDRGPYVAGRVIDLSHASAQALGLKGVDPVTLAQM